MPHRKVCYMTVSYTHLDVYKRQTLQLSPLIDYGVLATTSAPATGINPQSILAYNFTPGDRCRIISQTNQSTGNVTLVNSFNDVQVFSYDAATNILCIEALNADIVSSEKNILIELYTCLLYTSRCV